MTRRNSVLIFVLTASLILVGCKSSDDVAEVAKDKAKEALELAERAKEGLSERTSSLEGLSDSVRAWIEEGAEGAEGGVESLILEATQIARLVGEIGKVIGEAVDSETIIEPICQRLDDEEAMAKTEKAIGDMPRVEVIEGLKAGFKDLTSTDTEAHVKEKGYLVIWRYKDYRVGFVYRTKKTIDIDKLVQEVPKIVKQVNAALD